MSRCFPYPPPGYCRNGATYEALIESIKLQKETDKAKAERKKEKRSKKEKKEKKKSEKEKKVKSQNNTIQDSHKLLQKDQIKETKINNEVLERSDLTEEHGQPIKPSYSSDSTQNSNKRRRDNDDDVLLPDDITGHGKPIKIRLLKKQKGSDSINLGENVGSSYRNNGVPATSGRENNAVQGFPLTLTKSNSLSERARISKPNKPNGPHLGQQQFLASSSSAKPSKLSDTDAQVLKSRQQIESFVRPVVSQSQTQSQLEYAIPSTSGSRNIGVQGPSSGRQQSGPSNLNFGPGILGPFINKPNLPSTGKRSINEITVAGNKSGPTKPDKKKEGSKKLGLTRVEKKIMKKHSKYEKLIKSWVPPVIQSLMPNVGDDEDWLCKKPETTKQSSNSSREVETCREGVESSLWQPRARFLVDADIQALPYTVPF